MVRIHLLVRYWRCKFFWRWWQPTKFGIIQMILRSRLMIWITRSKKKNTQKIKLWIQNTSICRNRCIYIHSSVIGSLCLLKCFSETLRICHTFLEYEHTYFVSFFHFVLVFPPIIVYKLFHKYSYFKTFLKPISSRINFLSLRGVFNFFFDFP